MERINGYSEKFTIKKDGVTYNCVVDMIGRYDKDGEFLYDITLSDDERNYSVGMFSMPIYQPSFGMMADGDIMKMAIDRAPDYIEELVKMY